MGKSAAGEALDAVFEAIAEALVRSEDVRIAGFGTFDIKSRPAHTGRNPRTGEVLYIPATRPPSLKASTALTTTVN